MHKGANYYIHAMQGGDLMMMLMQAILNANLLLKHMLIWVKNNHVLGRLDYHYKHEPILYGWKEGSHKFYGKNQTSVWEVNKPHQSKLHPTMKPVELAERAMLNSSQEGDIVLDPFAGAGYSLIAAEKLRRVWHGIELDPKYVDVIVKRWENYTGLTAKRAAHE
jgi:DNA modification methylase